jgi:5'-phosphate synthase pdxT subunit
VFLFSSPTVVWCSVFYEQVRTPNDLENLDGIILPGGESTAMGLIGTYGNGKTMWEYLKEFSATKPIWGTCAGMILLAEKCVGASAVIENGQALIGGIDITVCRNYFGSQVSSFEMDTPSPPGIAGPDTFPGVFIRAPAILSANSQGIDILGKVTATPCLQAAAVLKELERKIAAGEQVVQMSVVDGVLQNASVDVTVVMRPHSIDDTSNDKAGHLDHSAVIVLPGASATDAREVICAARKANLLCTSFHPELTDDSRWHEYFLRMVNESIAESKSL